MPESNVNPERRNKRHKRKNPKVTVAPVGGHEFFLNILTNDPRPEAKVVKEMILKMFYEGATSNSIAYVDALHVPSNKVVPTLVGFEENAETGLVDLIPLAYIITSAKDIENLRMPDEKGGYHRGPTENVEEPASAEA